MALKVLGRRIGNGFQERQALAYFRAFISEWRKEFTEDNWPTSASHLHELLHRAMIQEGADPKWIEPWKPRGFNDDWPRDPRP